MAVGHRPTVDDILTRLRAYSRSPAASTVTKRSPGGASLIQRAFAPPGPSVAQSLKVQGGGSPTLGLCWFNIWLEKPVGGLPGLGLFPTARESGFEQTAPGIPVP